MLVRVSSCGTLYWSEGELIWDDHLGHRQLKLAEGTEQVLRWFGSWREPESVRDADENPETRERLVRITRAMIRYDVLVVKGSSRQRREEEILRDWGPWGASARAFHFGTRSLRQTEFTTSETTAKTLLEKAKANPPPSPVRPSGDFEAIPLPEPSPEPLNAIGLGEALRKRRSVREFGEEPLPLRALSALLTAARPTRPETHPDIPATGNVFKTSPSGGARHPTEVYVYARNVGGLECGVYHYDAFGHGLTPLGGKIDDDELVALAGDQEWTGNAGALLIYTSVIERNQWKYPVSRTYRILLMDVGHLSQTVYLLATALGLNITFTAALRDEMVEQLLGCDPANELVLGMSVLGTPA
ncbi:SagB/ThcOx family dehydrogenase [Amycolatopsis pittospori]|uniref:SagB/ThcOx family dehydrogenase n=1 Tax=Amycolatopsis pittospori TaxID=2749434 RepID=UPI0015F0AC6D|nr:SagB/ThcOx family dehydrogenase [Amycolatopsis pittospori]